MHLYSGKHHFFTRSCYLQTYPRTLDLPSLLRTSSKSVKFRFSKSFFSVKNKRNLSELFFGLKNIGLGDKLLLTFFFENFDFLNLRLLILSLNSPVNWWNWHVANVRKLEHRKTHFFRKSSTFLRMVRTHDLFCFFLQIFHPAN